MKGLSRNIIEHAKRLYPKSIHYRGKLTDKQYYKIEKQCKIYCVSLYMDGSVMYCVRFKAESEENEC